MIKQLAEGIELFDAICSSYSAGVPEALPAKISLMEQRQQAIGHRRRHRQRAQRAAYSADLSWRREHF